MQTFLPFRDFSQSASVLDNDRLRKQKIEVGDILGTLTGKSQAWKNHPAVLQWVGHGWTLIDYGLAIAEECENRGFAGDGDDRIWKFTDIIIPTGSPEWLGRADIHSSHRSRLLFKGRVDAVCYSLRAYLGVRSINEWLVANGYPKKNLFKHFNVIKLENHVKVLGVTVQPNWYAQFGWTEDDTQGYVWPVRNAH